MRKPFSSDEAKETRQFFKPILGPLLRAGLWFSSGDILETVSDINLKRDLLPEPFDFPDHIGNFREGAMVTVGAFAMMGLKAVLEFPYEKSLEAFRRRAAKVTLGAFAVSAAVQGIGEKFELTNSAVAPNTGDALDAAYGIGWSAVVAMGGYHMATTLAERYSRESKQFNSPIPIDVPTGSLATVDYS